MQPYTLLTTDDLKYVQQRYQFSFYPKKNISTIYAFTIGWHMIIQKPVMIYGAHVALLEVSTYATLRDVLMLLQYSHAHICLENGFESYDLLTILDTPIYSSSMIQFKLYSNIDVFVWWNAYWNTLGHTQRYPEIKDVFDIDAKKAAKATTVVIDNGWNEAPTTVVDIHHDNPAEAMLDTREEHISYYVALAVLD